MPLLRLLRRLPGKNLIKCRAALGEKPVRKAVITGLKVRHTQFQGYIDHINSTQISGWVLSADSQPVSMVLSINGEPAGFADTDIYRQDLIDNKICTRAAGFSFYLPKAFCARSFDFDIYSKIGGSLLFSGRYVADRTTEQINALTVMQQALRTGAIPGLEGPGAKWLIEHMVPEIMQSIHSDRSARIHAIGKRDNKSLPPF